VNVREVLNTIFYVLWTGCQWKALPKYLDLWDWDGTLGRIHHALYAAGREASPTTAIVDSQAAKGAVKGPAGVHWHRQLTDNVGVRRLVSRCYEVVGMAKTCHDIGSFGTR
jgi:transposase